MYRSFVPSKKTASKEENFQTRAQRGAPGSAEKDMEILAQEDKNLKEEMIHENNLEEKVESINQARVSRTTKKYKF